jgi:hypothetical protein
MLRLVRVGALSGALLFAGSQAYAFECPVHFQQADAAIATAMEAMKAMPDGANKGLVHTLIDDAKAFLASGKHNHEKPAAGGYDHARSIAKAKAAIGYAEAAEMMASR